MSCSMYVSILYPCVVSRLMSTSVVGVGRSWPESADVRPPNGGRRRPTRRVPGRAATGTNLFVSSTHEGARRSSSRPSALFDHAGANLEPALFQVPLDQADGLLGLLVGLLVHLRESIAPQFAAVAFEADALALELALNGPRGPADREAAAR